MPVYYVSVHNGAAPAQARGQSVAMAGAGCGICVHDLELDCGNCAFVRCETDGLVRPNNEESKDVRSKWSEIRNVRLGRGKCATTIVDVCRSYDRCPNGYYGLR